MSRIGKLPIHVPAGVTVTISDDNVVTVKGPKGELNQKVNKDISVGLDNGVLTVTRPSDSKPHRSMHGLYRALINNIVVGVTNGFQKVLLMEGVGYRAQAQGDKLNLSLGFSHPIVHQMPAGVKCETPSQTEIVIKGADKQKVGQTAAVIRSYRATEPYKGKGVRYVDEVVVIKETKKK